jgi:hypothetical protein
MQRYLLPMAIGTAILFGIAFGTLNGDRASAMSSTPAASQSR